jgi:hypothetical protein
MIKLTQSIPYLTGEERKAFSHDQSVFNALQLLTHIPYIKKEQRK